MVHNCQHLAVFNSAHQVMKAEDILKKCGLDILLIPAPRALSTDCGLAIIFNSSLNDNVLQALKSEKLFPTIIYRKVSDSLYEPIWRGENGKEQF